MEVAEEGMEVQEEALSECGVGESLGSYPIVDMAEHVGFLVACDAGLGGHGGSYEGGFEEKAINEDSLPEPIAPTMTVVLSPTGCCLRVPSSSVATTEGGGSVSATFLPATATDSSPVGRRLGESTCDEATEMLEYCDKGMKVAVGRGAFCGNPMDGTLVLGGTVEAVDGGELDGGSRSVGTGTTGTCEMVFLVTSASRKRLGKALSSLETILKNLNTESEDNLVNCPVFFVPELWSCKGGNDGLLTIGRKALSPSSKVMRSEISISSISDNDVRNCNSRFWLENEESEAQKLWNIGKDLGLSFDGKEEVVLKSLQALEVRDKGNMNLKRKECVVSDDENN